MWYLWGGWSQLKLRLSWAVPTIELFISKMLSYPLALKIVLKIMCNYILPNFYLYNSEERQIKLFNPHYLIYSVDAATRLQGAQLPH